MSKEIAEMDSVFSPWPANLDTAQVLAIRSECSVPDAYQLICDRKNIKKLLIAGREYTNQEVRNMSFSERLGGDRFIEGEAPTPGGEPGFQPTVTMLPSDLWIPESTHNQTLTPAPTYNPYPTYEQTMEALRRDNPNYDTFGDVSPVTPATAPQSIIFTADAGTWVGIDPIHDYYGF